MIRDHLFPVTLKEALELKNYFGKKAVFVGGGTDLFVQIYEKKIMPEYLIDLNTIPELSGLEDLHQDNLRLGACLTVDHISKSTLIKKNAPSLSIAACKLGSPPIRNQATIGGNLINASPAADLAPPLISQGAMGHLVSSKGGRAILIEKLSTGVNKTILLPDEILTHISIPIRQYREGMAYFKLGLRGALSIAVASVAVWLRRKKSGKGIEKIRIAMGSVAPRVIRASKAEGLLTDNSFEKRILKEASDLASRECQPISDIRASSDYRRSMIGELVLIGLETAWAASKN